MGIVDAIKRGFGVASKNLALVLILVIFNLIWNMINIALVPQAAMPAPGATAPVEPPAISPQASLITLAVTVLFMLISILMQGGSLGAVKDYVKEGSMNLSKFVSYGLKYYLRLLSLGLLIFLFIVIIAIIAALLIAVTAPLNNIIATVIASIIAIAIGLAGIYFVFLIVMAPYSFVCEEAGVIDAIKRSIRIVRKSFWRILLLLVLLVLIAIGIAALLGVLTYLLALALPVKIGQIIIGVTNSLLNGYLGVVMTGAFMVYYLALAGEEKVVAEKVF